MPRTSPVLLNPGPTGQLVTLLCMQGRYTNEDRNLGCNNKASDFSNLTQRCISPVCPMSKLETGGKRTVSYSDSATLPEGGGAVL